MTNPEDTGAGEALPRPFCGNPDAYAQDASSNHKVEWQVQCDNCSVSKHTWSKTREEAIADWNTRAAPSAPAVAFDASRPLAWLVFMPKGHECDYRTFYTEEDARTCAQDLEASADADGETYEVHPLAVAPSGAAGVGVSEDEVEAALRAYMGDFYDDCMTYDEGTISNTRRDMRAALVAFCAGRVGK